MNRLRRENGFTLIELLIAMPMLLILLGGLTLTFVEMTRASNTTQEEATLQTEARDAIATLDADIRGAFVGDGTDPVLSATATSIDVESPDRYPTTTTGTSESSFHLRNVIYTVANGTLRRQVTTSTNTFPSAPPWAWPGTNGPTTTVLGSITNTDVFTFYTAAGAQTSPPTALTFPITDTTGIRAVGIKLTLSTFTNQGKSFTLTDLVALRETDS